MKRIIPVLLCLLLLTSTCLADANTWTCPNDGRIMESFSPRCTLCGVFKSEIVWECSIGHQNSPEIAFCVHCGEPKDAATDVQNTASEAPFEFVIDGSVFFGTYPQTTDGTDCTPIEWLVLDINEAEHRALIISRYGLDVVAYNDKNEPVTWQTSPIRAWLNDSFITAAFTSTEQDAILLTDVDNSRSQNHPDYSKTTSGSDTQDKVFLLSTMEANRYFGVQSEDIEDSDRNIKARIQPTAYAISRNAFTSDTNTASNGMPSGWWWFRSSGNVQSDAAGANSAGVLSSYDVIYDSGCVRPVMWVDLNADIFHQ